MKNTWTNAEIKQLFSLVEQYKKQGKPIIDAFYEHAKNYGRQPLSVRNFYYSKVDEISSNTQIQNKLAINIKLHEKNNYAKFDERQTQKLLEQIKKRTSEGLSIRKACLELANGNAKELLRFQNKYREIVKKQQGKIAIEQEKNQKNAENNSKITKKTAIFNKKGDFPNFENCNDKATSKKNIISFPVEQKLIPQSLSEAEIQSLFVGLAKLVKKSALAEMEEKMKLEREKISIVVRKSTMEIGQKSEKIEQLLDENKKLSKQVLVLKEKLEEMRTNCIKV